MYLIFYSAWSHCVLPLRNGIPTWRSTEENATQKNAVAEEEHCQQTISKCNCNFQFMAPIWILTYTELNHTRWWFRRNTVKPNAKLNVICSSWLSCALSCVYTNIHVSFQPVSFSKILTPTYSIIMWLWPHLFPTSSKSCFYQWIVHCKFKLFSDLISNPALLSSNLIMWVHGKWWIFLFYTSLLLYTKILPAHSQKTVTHTMYF